MDGDHAYPLSLKGTKSVTIISTKTSIPLPPMPCTVRPVTIIASPGRAAPVTAEPIPKRTMERIKMGRRPKEAAKAAKKGNVAVEERALHNNNELSSIYCS